MIFFRRHLDRRRHRSRPIPGRFRSRNAIALPKHRDRSSNPSRETKSILDHYEKPPSIGTITLKRRRRDHTSQNYKPAQRPTQSRIRVTKMSKSRESEGGDVFTSSHPSHHFPLAFGHDSPYRICVNQYTHSSNEPIRRLANEHRTTRRGAPPHRRIRPRSCCAPSPPTQLPPQFLEKHPEETWPLRKIQGLTSNQPGRFGR